MTPLSYVALLPLLRARCSPEPNSGCWLWEGPINQDGYAKARIVRGGPKVFVHRALYLAIHGSIPAGQEVCHRCDVRSCLNPDHLFAATHLENIADCVAKRRTVRGERAGLARVTWAQVREIRAWLAAGETTGAIARTFGVSGPQISKIGTGRQWRPW
jgi:hypothetical protein